MALMDGFDAGAALRLNQADAERLASWARRRCSRRWCARRGGSAGAAAPLRDGGGRGAGAELARGVEETFGCALRDGYGISEVGGGITLAPVATPPRTRSVGPALPGSELRIVDLATRRAAAVGERARSWSEAPA